MCGIFGIFLDQSKEKIEFESFEKKVNTLFYLSESRGKEASGLVLTSRTSAVVYKEPIPASWMTKKNNYKNFFFDFFKTQTKSESCLVAMGHSRMVTNGSESSSSNNQPVVKDNIICLHNGIIVNDELLWKKYPHLKREFQVDTEIINSLLSMRDVQGVSLKENIREFYNDIEGSASIAVLFKNRNEIVFATNTGSLYFAENKEETQRYFASEKMILVNFLSEIGEETNFSINQIKARSGVVFNTLTNKLEKFSFSAENPYENKIQNELVVFSRKFVDLSTQEEEARQNLKRCSVCVLPETIPFINFDKNGVCQKCRSYKKLTFHGEEALREILKRSKKSQEGNDSLVALSGGRDSSFGLHYLVKEIGFKPVAYTYDWGLITDLARRNISRLCGQLGVEHILVSADIRNKRENVRRNIQAWVKDPRLGMVTLFMAGDKDYFYHAQRLKNELHLENVFLSSNRMEKTGFKSGFCGVDEGDSWWHSVSTWDKAKMAFYFGSSILRNPGYWNRSVIDTFNAMRSSFILSHSYHQLFDYIPWHEDSLIKTLKDKCNWEFASDTKNSWRIGDGTAAFYNYIYYTIAGFTENDTFRSFQIREGHLSRSEALALVERDNQPRYEAMKQYAQVIGFDLQEVFNKVNSLPKLYS